MRTRDVIATARPWTLGLALAVLAIALSAFPAIRAGEAGHSRGDIARHHQAQLLVADRSMQDPRFRQSVIFVIEHSDDGALGLIVNKRIARRPLSRLLDDIGVEYGKPLASDPVLSIRFGGPVEPSRAFILHTPDYRTDGTAEVTDFAFVTTNPEILTAIAEGDGPERATIILGYSGWSPGQLERELERDDWIAIDAEASLLFGDAEAMWRRALERRPMDL